MPFIVDDQEEQKNNATQNGSQQTNNQVNLGPESGILDNSAASGAGVQTDQSKPTQSGAYTNIQQYLGTNADQAEGLATKVGSGVQSTVDQAKSSADQAKSSFESDVNAQKTNLTPELLQPLQSYTPDKGIDYSGLTSASGRPAGPQTDGPDGSIVLNRPAGKYTDGPGIVQPSPTPTPTTTNAQLQSLVGDQNYLNSLSKVRDANYSGPTDINQNYLTEARSRANEATQLGENTKTEAGRNQLLASTVGRPTYTSGERLLDQSLLQQSEPAKNVFQNIQSQVAGLPSYLDSLASNENAYAGNVQGQVASNKQAVMDALSGVQSKYSQTLNDRLQNALQYAVPYEKDAINEEQGMRAASAAKLNPELSALLKGIDATKFYTLQDPTKQSIASGNDVLEAQALGKLMGKDLNDPYAGLFAPTDNVTNVGGFVPNPQFDTSGYNTAVLNRGQDFSNKYNALLKANPIDPANLADFKRYPYEEDAIYGADDAGYDARDLESKLFNVTSGLSNLRKEYGLSDLGVPPPVGNLPAQLASSYEGYTGKTAPLADLNLIKQYLGILPQIPGR